MSVCLCVITAKPADQLGELGGDPILGHSWADLMAGT